ncbi:unnamed protein product [Staurois parvus]|uniref:Uncharacterized protein n=1 Tax=Staurois parvus TaxID=386267 RepID=A0ABN9FSE7_9NEOB|nr:unnamed protein product [Staurois parvus]
MAERSLQATASPSPRRTLWCSCPAWPPMPDATTCKLSMTRMATTRPANQLQS